MPLFRSPILAASVAAVALCLTPAACAPAPSASPDERAESGWLNEPTHMASALEARPISFVVRFAANHALGRAQALHAAGEGRRAERLAREAITASPELDGLCFDRFTTGGAETVLTACQPVSAALADSAQRHWLGRLRTMKGVQYVDVNVVVRV